ncbi:hypothetical protein FQA47_024827 [Oryzias melastigma]|uniref:Uncharacterized protein n=1 Tax=Oryzias melastigma TaxID=30732 RepID=A0A834FKE0_ORYME|nr:hypothetical protein FQA47_024827 [Oryzias melastigma]
MHLLHLLLFCSPSQEGPEIKCSAPLPLLLCVCWLQIQPRVWIPVSQSDVATSAAQLALLLLPPPASSCLPGLPRPPHTPPFTSDHTPP